MRSSHISAAIGGMACPGDMGKLRGAVTKW